MSVFVCMPHSHFNTFIFTDLTLQPFNRTQPIGLNPPVTFGVLRCDIFANFTLNRTTIESRWNISTTVEVLVPGSSDDKYDISQGPAAMNGYETLMIIQNLSYIDAGVYTCRVRDSRDPSNRGPWVEAQAHLQLLGKNINLTESRFLSSLLLHILVIKFMPSLSQWN